MKVTILKKSFVAMFLILILFSVSGNIFGAINTTYQNGKTVIEDDLNTKAKDSVILDALGPFVYWVASAVENLVGKAFKGLTGTEMFPWADRVLFNTLPMLDINIFNPADASMFKTKAGTTTPLAKIVRNTYFTVLTLSVAFLTVVVGIAATKLALSSIASEKAKYKEAVTKWMFSIVLIFLMHNVVSFIFWVNEQMVVVASGLVNETLLNANLSLLQEALNMPDQQMLEIFKKANKSNVEATKEETQYVSDHPEVAAKFIKSSNYNDSILFDALAKPNWFTEMTTGNGKDSLRALVRDMKIINGETITYTSKDAVLDNQGNTSYKNVDHTVNMSNFVEFSKEIDSTGLENMQLGWEGNASQDAKNVANFFYYQVEKMLGADKTHKDNKYLKKYVKAMISVYDSVNNTEGNGQESQNSGVDIIAGLGNYFKEAAYTVETDELGNAKSWKRNKVSLIGAILYAIFVFQSIFYFLAYLKRFFFIVVLVIMAPIIVLLDFFRKAIV